jgi:ssRNA-specific RNase YbeY (16S rRNA maturation enzyme)
MLKTVFIIITTVHGLVHLMGFMKAFDLAKIPQ